MKMFSKVSAYFPHGPLPPGQLPPPPPTMEFCQRNYCPGPLPLNNSPHGQQLPGQLPPMKFPPEQLSLGLLPPDNYP